MTRAAMEVARGDDYLARMDSETRAALAALSDRMTEGFAAQAEAMRAGFARVDHYFELQQLQFLEWRSELRGEFGELRGEFGELRERVDALTQRVGRLEHEVMLLRDYVTREIAEIRLELRDLRSRSLQTDDLRRDVAALTVRVERLEERHTE